MNPKNMATKRIYSKLKVVEIDETHGWSDDIVAKAGRLFGVYLYDERVQTFMAELTPSYCLTFLYTNTENHVDDDTHEEIMNSENHESTYLHVHSVDQMKSIDLRGHGVNFRFTSSDTKFYRENFDRAVEYLNGNHVV